MSQFTGTSVATMEPVIDNLVLGWLDSLRTRFASHDRSKCNIGQKIQFLTVDIITKICLGDEIGCVKNDKDMHRILETVEIGNKACQYFSVFLELNSLLFYMARVPMLRRVLFPKPSDDAGVGRLMGVGSPHIVPLSRDIRSLLGKQIVHDVVEKRADDESSGEDVVASLLRRGMPKDQIDSELIIALVAGSDTTSTSIQSTLLCIVTNPQVYDTLRSEIRRAVASGQVSNPIQDTEAKQLVYLQACVMEGMRKFPPLSQLRERVVPPEGDILGRFRLPGGTFVGLNSWGVQLNKNIYGQDADIYRPERWLTDDTFKLQAMYQTHSLIFGHGSTKCLGMSMAMMEITKVIFEKHFEVTLSKVENTQPPAYECVEVSDKN
ncbi:hypothetical protein N0V82_003252 [Gnomoniopsis sp. IMI 355080]|nr:hypothetical protein N0V82_003252 [Gnomoniopsis sp. IMI 355080]